MPDQHRADIPTWECLDLVNASSVGRLCFLDGDTPIAFPVSFKLHRRDASAYVVMRTATRSLMAKYSGPASFEVDEIDVTRRKAWSVVIRGIVRHSHEAGDLPAPDPWIADGRHLWLLLEVGAVSGRRFVARSSTHGYSVEWDLEGGPRS
jgi:nitroimidazol reductase NimA-like FMN-containing flavoprotein (pyridoxamine 5'-phosphate oxidase superfamily)